MNTIFDVIAVAIFAGLVVLFLQRSVSPEPAEDSLLQYLVASTGCAIGNFLGNEGRLVPALLVIAATLAYIIYFLRPFSAR